MEQAKLQELLCRRLVWRQGYAQICEEMNLQMWEAKDLVFKHRTRKETNHRRYPLIPKFPKVKNYKDYLKEEKKKHAPPGNAQSEDTETR